MRNVSYTWAPRDTVILDPTMGKLLGGADFALEWSSHRPEILTFKSQVQGRAEMGQQC